MCDSEAVGNLTRDNMYFTKSLKKGTTVESQVSMKIAGVVLLVMVNLGQCWVTQTHERHS